MAKKIGVVLVLLLLIGAVDAIENTYQKHNVSFQFQLTGVLQRYPGW
jgi:hypothetical protein